MDQHTMLVIAAIIATVVMPFSMIWIGHWFPWRKLIRRQLRRGEAYIYGTACILIMPLFLMAAHGLWFFAAMLALSAATAGAATGLAYWIDKVAEDKHRREDEQDRRAYGSQYVTGE